MWCYFDHDDIGLLVLAMFGGKNYVGPLELREYFSQRKEVAEKQFNDHTREIGKRLGSGSLKLVKLECERHRGA